MNPPLDYARLTRWQRRQVHLNRLRRAERTAYGAFMLILGVALGMAGMGVWVFL